MLSFPGPMAVRLGYDAPLLAAIAGRLARAVMQDMAWRRSQPCTRACSRPSSASAATSAFMFTCIIPFLACQQDEDAPDLAEIAAGYCKTIQMCDSEDGWEDQEVCEAYSADEFERTKTENNACFDARIIMEICLGAFESCDEYAEYKQVPDYECRTEFLEFIFACLEP